MVITVSRISLALIRVVLPLAVPSVMAQTVSTGNCSRPLAEGVLDVNNVRVAVFNAGIAEYEAPVGSGNQAILTTDIWVGGYVGEELRVAGERFGGWEFWPGPLNPGAELPDPEDCSEYDRIFQVTRDDIEQFDQTGLVSDDLADWPWNLGAPVVDGDGVAANYDLQAGDRPEIIGSRRLWWVMNDVGNEHLESESDPLGIEVHGTAAAMPYHDDAINNATIHSFRVINRLSVPIDSMFIGVYSEADLGWQNDIFVGADTTIGMTYAYNPDNEDPEFYGGAPPAIGMVLIKGWPSGSDEMDNDYDGETDESGEEAGLSHFMWWWDEDIHDAREKYNFMTGRFWLGNPLTYGGMGEDGTTRTRFLWPGDPVSGSYWSAVNIDSAGTRGYLGRPGSVSSFGPFRLEPGSSAEFVFAYVWAQGEDNLDSIMKLRAAASAVQAAYENAYITQTEVADPSSLTVDGIMARAYPDPASEHVTLSFSLGTVAAVRIELFDIMGRAVATVIDQTLAPGDYQERLSVRDFAPGLYLYRISMGGDTATGRLIVAK